MKTIAIANQKGGTGKTTTAYNLGIALTQQSYRVLMVDFDPQGNLSCYCGIPPEQDLEQTITELLMKVAYEKPLSHRECVYQSRRTDDSAPQVDFIPSNLRLASFELAMGTMMCREVLLKTCLEQYSSQYDYCIIDCSPSVGLLLTNALSAANEVIIPMQAQPFSVVGMSQLTNSISSVQRKINPGLHIRGVLLTMTQHTKVSEHYAHDVRAKYGRTLHVFTTEIPYNVKVQESQAFAAPTILYEPKSSSARAYVEFTQEVLGHGREEADGTKWLRAVKNIDVTHAYVGHYGCHIQQYAEGNFRIGCYVAPEHPQPGDNLDKLQIYQITKGGCEYRFMNYAYSKSRIHAADYSSVYIANLPADYDLDRCFQEFNAPNRPLRYHMCSLSTSDIVVTTTNGKETAYYVDSIGFKDVSHLLPELHEVEAQRQKEQVQDEPER